MSGSKVKHNAAKRSLGLAKSVSLDSTHRQMAGKSHSHFCSDRACRLHYEDSCQNPGVNERCHTCRGERRTWVDSKTGLHAHDPRPCCADNTDQVTRSEDLLRYDLAGPGPWFQCRTCRRAHGDPCITPTERTAP